MLIQNINKIINNHIIKYYNSDKLAKNKVLIKNTLEYAFYYSNINFTKENCTSKTNINNNVNHSRSSYERNLNKINIIFFKNLYDEIKNLFNNESINYKYIIDIFNDNVFNDLNEIKLSSIDGVCSEYIKNNKLYTNQDVYNYDSINDIPLNIMNNKNIKIFDNNKNNKSNKNGETVIFNNFIKDNDLEQQNNTIYIGDRLYSSYTVINNLLNKNQNFVIRLKDNLDLLKNDIRKTSKNSDKNDVINNNNIRIIKYETISTDIIKNKKSNKELKFNIKKHYNLVTNLPENIYNDEIIKLIYKFRWKIEVFFKNLKNNFKFDIFYLKDQDEIEKLKYIEMIIFTINKLILLYCLDKKYKLNSNIFNNIVKIKESILLKKDMRFKKNKEAYNNYLDNNYYKCSIRINLSSSLTGFYDLLLSKIINGKLNEKDIDIYNKNYVKIQRNKLNRNFNRISILPFSKWYIKSYSKINEFKKIIKAIENNKVDSLNKNLKLKANELLSQKTNNNFLYKIKELLF